MTLLWKPLLAVSLPMQGDDFDYSLIHSTVYGSPKLDGVRAMVQNGRVVSRNGREFPNKAVQEKFGGDFFEGLDGELILGKPYGQDAFNRTSGVTNSGQPEAYQSALKLLQFNVFDVYSSSDFARRNAANGELFKNSSGIRLVEQTLICNVEQLKAYEAKQLAMGYEGVMLRRADQGAYPQKPGKENRSTLKAFDLVRLKRFEYDFARILEVHPLEHNLNTEKTATGKRSTKKSGVTVDASLIGSATLQDVKTGVKFNTTIGSNALRGWVGWKNPALWQGKQVRYKWQVCGTKDKPRINSCGFTELGV